MSRQANDAQRILEMLKIHKRYLLDQQAEPTEQFLWMTPCPNGDDGNRITNLLIGPCSVCRVPAIGYLRQSTAKATLLMIYELADRMALMFDEAVRAGVPISLENSKEIAKELHTVSMHTQGAADTIGAMERFVRRAAPHAE